jgi:mevalonate kinase
VVYGGPSLSAAIDLYATATLEDANPDALEVVLKDLNMTLSLNADELKALYSEYSKRNTSTPEDLAKYIVKNEKVGKELLPYATIAARLFAEQGVGVLGKRVTIHSDVPMQKGYASSVVCSAAFTMALVRGSGKKIDDAVAVDIVRDGERIVHKSETAGRIDCGPAYFGGYATFSASAGVKKEDISTDAKFVVIDTGPKPPTAEMVGKVRKMYDADKEGTTKVLREIDACVLKCIDALKRNDLREVGRQMSRNHELLKSLGVSSEGLDKAVAIATASGAYGAKLCGGGGGGMAVALVSSTTDAIKVIEALKGAGFSAYSVNIGLKGAKDY